MASDGIIGEDKTVVCVIVDLHRLTDWRLGVDDRGSGTEVREGTPPEDKTWEKGTCILLLKCILKPEELTAGATFHKELCAGLIVHFLSRVIHCLTTVGREVGTKWAFWKEPLPQRSFTKGEVQPLIVSARRQQGVPLCFGMARSTWRGMVASGVRGWGFHWDWWWLVGRVCVDGKAAWSWDWISSLRASMDRTPREV